MSKSAAESFPTRQFESRFLRPKQGRTLIVGSRIYEGRQDRRQLYEDAVGLDMLAGMGVDVVANLEESLPKGFGKFSHVECLSVLEHSRQPWKLAANLQRVMHAGATLYLSVPFVWRLHQYPGDFWRFTRQGVRELFPLISWMALCQANEELKRNDLLQVIESESGHPYFARTEILGWGMKLP